ncbi:nitroreductase family protein [Desulfosediminicola sp.]|uniref:nitroreductase family protein n=1 Tax=Desulfosediminicola sp. TaxID=2886825 RepID=UPI003AF27753
MPKENFELLVKQTRTHRRFKQDQAITTNQLESLIKLARLSGSARNCQPWQYALVNDPALCDKIFPHLGWAGYLSEWKGPASGERPAAYILCLLNQNWLKGTDKEAHFDLGIASQNMLLGATSQQLSGCRIGAFSPKLADLFTLPDHLKLELVIALGAPAENVVLEEMASPDQVKYWRDENQVHHVPKRPISEIIVNVDLR